MSFKLNRLNRNKCLKQKGIALVTALIFMLLVTIIAGASLSITTKQARLAEHQIRRVKAFYAAEAAIIKAYQSLRYVDATLAAPPPMPGINWTDAGGGIWQWDWSEATAAPGFEWVVDGDGNILDTSRLVIVTYDTTTNRLTATINYSP